MAMQRINRREWIGLFVVFAALLLALLVWRFTPTLYYNIHTVIPGQAYRSAQLTDTALNEFIGVHRIRSIVNLRGVHDDEAWFQDEASTAASRHVEMFNISLPAHGMPSKAQLRQLYVALQQAPRPVLVHCRQGADRSGLASAILLMLSDKRDFAQAEGQTSWYYRAFAFDSVGKVVLQHFKHWADVKGLPANRKSFQAWLAV